MATNFPSGLDALTNPVSTDGLDSPDHAGQHSNVNDAVEALESKVGVDGSAVTTSLDYRVRNINAVSAVVSASSSTDLVRITQTGTGNALVVEDSTNPDATSFVIDSGGNIGIGGSASAAFGKVHIYGFLRTSPSQLNDALITSGRAGGSSGHAVTLTPTTLTSSQTLTLPDATGTVALFGTAVSLIATQTFVSSTTYVMPAGAKIAIVEGCGGGGGGGGGPRNITTNSGGCGGSGAPRVTKTIPVTGGASYTVTIGAGGAGGAGYIINETNNTGKDGVNGGISRFGTLYFSGGFGSIAGVTGQGHLISGEVPIASNPSSNYLGSGGLGGTLTTKFGRNSNSAGGGGGGGQTNTNGNAGGGYFDDLSLVIVNSGSVAGLIVAKSGDGAAGGATGTAGTNGSTRQGGGGGGGLISSTLNAGNGGNGGAGGGGGGGGGGLQVTGSSNTAASGTGGTGGTGEIKIWVYG